MSISVIRGIQPNVTLGPFEKRADNDWPKVRGAKPLNSKGWLPGMAPSSA